MTSGTSFICSCHNEFSGQRCEIRDPCIQNPCMNGGQCSSNGMGGFNCICLQSFTGQRCEDRTSLFPRRILSLLACLGADPCLTQPCRNGATCRPIDSSSYQCICPSGYSGYDCATGMFVTSLHALILVSVSSLSAMDPCSLQPCRNGATCRPLDTSSYQCICLASYTGYDCATSEFRLMLYACAI